MKPKDCRVHVPAFREYLHKVGSTWGVLHVSFDDGNFTSEISESWFDDSLSAEEELLIMLHNSMSPTQRRKVRDMAEENE